MLTSHGCVCSLNVRMVKIIHKKLKMYQIVRMLTKTQRQIKLASLKQSKLNQHDLNDENCTCTLLFKQVGIIGETEKVIEQRSV